MRSAGPGRMLIIDASCLYEVVAGTETGEQIRHRIAEDQELAAPHVVDVEVLGTIRREHLLSRLDTTAAHIAIAGLEAWPGRRFSHTYLLPRAWELRNNVRTWDAFYVALAELLGGTLITRDARLAGAHGIRCEIEVV